MRPRDSARARLAPAALLGALLALAVASCAASSPPPAPAPLAGPRPRLVLLPLENLSGRAEAADVISRMLANSLAAGGQCEIVSPGDVDAAMTELRVRSGGLVTSDEVRAVAAKLEARWVLTGSVLEYTMVRSPDGELPSVGLTLRLLDGRSAKLAWSAMKVRTGEDRESVFGFGRETNLDKLAALTTDELMRGFRLPADSDSVGTGGGGR